MFYGIYAFIKDYAWMALRALLPLLIAGPLALQGQGFPTIPPDFEPVDSAKGVALYRKEYADGNPDYVQMVDLDQGAMLILQHGVIGDPGIGQGPYGGDNPTIFRQTLRGAWDGLVANNPDAFCITNGGFFDPNSNPTRLAFPLKIDGQIVSDGYGKDEYPNQKLMLEIWSERVDITTFSKEALQASSAENILAGLTEAADKEAERYTGRTFVGIGDGDQDGDYETVLIFNTLTARQSDAAYILRSFGADKVMMLDGGSSTQLLCRGTTYVSSDREIPQTLGVISSPTPDYYVTVAEQPNYPILVEGESLEVEVTLRNDGTHQWKASQCRLVNVSNPWGAPVGQLLTNDIPPGEEVSFSWTTDAFNKFGIYATEWGMVCGEAPLTGEVVDFSVIVIPQELEDQRKELEGKVKEWAGEQIENIEELVSEWIRKQLEEALTTFCDPTAGLIPLMAMIVISYSIKKKR